MALSIRAAIFILVVLAALLTVPVLIGVYVYRDARHRGMNAALWTLIAVAAPALIGFIIYLLVRGNYPDLQCPQCTKPVTEQYTVCPHCGAKLRPACPSCAAPVEPDWKVCPRCAAPLDGVQMDAAPPRRRQDRALNKILIAVILVPALLILFSILSFVMFQTGAPGSVSLQELTFEEYGQQQPSEAVRGAVRRWLDELEGREDRAYALRYDLPGEYDYENKTYFLVYVPAGGDQSNVGIGTSSSLLGSTLSLELERTGNSGSLFSVLYIGEKTPKLDITLGGRGVRCQVQTVGYNPTTFLIYPDYSQTPREDVAFLPQRITVVKLESTGKGASKNAGVVGVTDEDTLYRLMSAIDGGERQDWESPIYQAMSGLDISGGFEVRIEYKIREEYIMHEDMAILRVFQQDGACWLIDERIRHGDNFRLMNQGFYELLEGLFQEDIP